MKTRRKDPTLLDNLSRDDLGVARFRNCVIVLQNKPEGSMSNASARCKKQSDQTVCITGKHRYCKTVSCTHLKISQLASQVLLEIISNLLLMNGACDKYHITIIYVLWYLNCQSSTHQPTNGNGTYWMARWPGRLTVSYQDSCVADLQQIFAVTAIFSAPGYRRRLFQSRPQLCLRKPLDR